MKNPFPALIAYMLITTVSTYPVPSFILLGSVVLVGWLVAFYELLTQENPDEQPDQLATYLE